MHFSSSKRRCAWIYNPCIICSLDSDASNMPPGNANKSLCGPRLCFITSNSIVPSAASLKITLSAVCTFSNLLYTKSLFTSTTSSSIDKLSSDHTVKLIYRTKQITHIVTFLYTLLLCL